jgi:hypothetical protein
MPLKLFRINELQIFRSKLGSEIAQKGSEIAQKGSETVQLGSDI